MKKLIIAAVAATALLWGSSCNSELGPEYTTMPKVTNLTLSPRIAHLTEDDTIETVAPDQPVTLTCSFTNEYGWSRIYMSYRTLTPEEYEGKSESEVTQLWMQKFSSSDEIYKPMDHAVTFDAPVDSKPFAFSIPGQAEGTLVRWDFGYFNQYGLGAGFIAAGKLPQNQYEVVDLEAQQPELPKEPEN